QPVHTRLDVAQDDNHRILQSAPRQGLTTIEAVNRSERGVMAEPAVSVLMTAYNREKYVAAAIESVLAQRFTDFELIVVDDRSSDRTLEIAKEYEARDSRVRVFANERNLGDYPNRNR